jgi:hypothetical protein
MNLKESGMKDHGLMCYPDTYLDGLRKTSIMTTGVDKTYGSLSCEWGKYTSIHNFDWEIIRET